MKAIFEFDLDKTEGDQYLYNIYKESEKAHSFITDLLNEMRQMRKHGAYVEENNLDEGTIEFISGKIYDLLNDNELSV